MLTLSWQPPCDWAWLFGFLSARAVEGVEAFEGNSYLRTLAIGGHRGLVRATPDPQAHVLHVELSDGLLPVAAQCLQKLRGLFDTGCSPQQIAQALGGLAAARPGLRLPGCVDPFEQGVRAILGQLVSVAMAAKLAGRVAKACGTPLAEAPGFICFPTPEQLAGASPLMLKNLGMPLRRAEAIVSLARAALSGELPLSAPEDIEQGVRTLQRLPGIGRWTASYYALRGWQAKDIFLPDDYLIKQRFPGMTPAAIRRYAERWQPWRSYALLHIWYSDSFTPD
ncbi:DNA-3-methyladenine glycosylase 2 [Pluralibacter gergoviae]|uniref:DNA-3-methyladenine glycosylase 2 n=1 Tax=Pluralibacter gergoviae TaxID=61647 RepID=UPI0006521BB6|nr:DNA-3-methyladenine glycosylase 2 [Pluralibacter gergoviae]KMK08963.1 3-methyladenine DNA glycosylase [Pluralibacter gergoviae]